MASLVPVVKSESAFRLSSVVDRIGSSMIRDLLDIGSRPGLISLAGGLPAAEAFPASEIAEATAQVLATEAASALQYSQTQGCPELRSWVAQRHGVAIERVTITTGSQQALDLVARVLIEPGGTAALADPGYVGAIQALRLAGAILTPIPSDDGGLVVDVLEDRLRRGERPALVYVVANFHNPTGATMADSRRTALGALADRYGFVIIDDDPYGHLRWAGAAVAPMAAYAERVVTLGSFSKILSPGLRLGYLVAPPAVTEAVVLVKQPVDLHTSTLAQQIVHKVLSRPGFLDAHLARLCRLYGHRATTLAAALDKHFGPLLHFAPPEGGLFIWGRLADPGADTLRRHAGAVDNGVAYLPGAGFGIGQTHPRCLRLSFSTAPVEDLAEGVRRLHQSLVDDPDPRPIEPAC